MFLELSPTYIECLDSTIEVIKKAQPELLRQQGSFFVAGATGQLGKALVLLLDRINETQGLKNEIIAGCRSESRYIDVFSEEIRKRIKFSKFECGVKNEIPNFDFSVMSAGYADPASFITRPSDVMLANIDGTRALLEHIKRNKKGRLLYLSSGEIYGDVNSSVVNISETDYGYLDIQSPRACYPIVKKFCESLCVAFHKEHGCDALIARQSHVYGPGFSNKDTRVTAQFLNEASLGHPVIMKSAGSQRRSYMFELDAAYAHLLLLLKGTSCKAYNVAPCDSVTIKGFGEQVSKAAGVAFQQAFESDNLTSGYSNIKNSVLSNSELLKLGYRQVFPFEAGVNRTIACILEEERSSDTYDVKQAR